MARWLATGLLLAAVPAAAATPPARLNDGPITAIGETRIYRAVYEDTMMDIARRFRVGFVELRAANPDLNPWLPGDGARVTIPDMHLLPDAPQQGIVINVGEMRLYWFDKPGEPPQTFPVGIGREGLATPLGTTTVVRKAEGPTWRPTPRMRAEDPTLPAAVPPGPDNPLGTHMLYLGWPAYGIHGTSDPDGVGRRISAGCIRMYPDDIVALWPQVPLGTPVTVVDQPVKLGWINGELYMEAHPSRDQADLIELGQPAPYEVPAGLQGTLVEAVSGAGDVDWRAVRTALNRRDGVPVRISR